MSGLIADFTAARRYEPPDAPALARTDDRSRDADLAALRRWASAEPAALSSSRYMAYRAEVGRMLPHRNTLARRFGSWHGALDAAGLAKRSATTAELRAAGHAGGAVGREAHNAAQRERVLATLRYGVTIHGTLPTAMQFFRWRLIEAPATPSQATVYRLFPGGWQEVLDALGEMPEGVMSPAPRQPA